MLKLNFSIILNLFIFRSLKEIEAVLDFAKLSREEIKPKTQSIYFSDQLDSEGIKLLELDSAVIQALENGEKYLFLLTFFFLVD